MKALEKLKILKELEEMDLGHIEKLINMANLLKVHEQADVKSPESVAPASNS